MKNTVKNTIIFSEKKLTTIKIVFLFTFLLALACFSFLFEDAFAADIKEFNNPTQPNAVISHDHSNWKNQKTNVVWNFDSLPNYTDGILKGQEAICAVNIKVQYDKNSGSYPSNPANLTIENFVPNSYAVNPSPQILEEPNSSLLAEIVDCKNDNLQIYDNLIQNSNGNFPKVIVTFYLITSDGEFIADDKNRIDQTTFWLISWNVQKSVGTGWWDSQLKSDLKQGFCKEYGEIGNVMYVGIHKHVSLNQVPFGTTTSNNVATNQYNYDCQRSFPVLINPDPNSWVNITPNGVNEGNHNNITFTQINKVTLPITNFIVDVDDLKIINDSPPVITLNGAANIDVVQGEVYYDLGAICMDSDNKKWPITVDNTVDNTINTSSPIGTIFIQSYDCTDGNASALTVQRTVTIIAPNPTDPVPTLPDPITTDPNPTQHTNVEPEKKKGAGCNDCTPPTFYKNKDGKNIVKNGFSLNGKYTDVVNYHVPWDLIILPTNQTSTFSMKAFENQGTNNLKWFQIGFGLPEIGDPISNAEASLLISLDNGSIENVETSKNNLINFTNIQSSIVPCGYADVNCIEVTGEILFRDQLKYNVIIIEVVDNKRNNAYHFINDGINSSGESLNEPITYKLFNKKSNQQKDNLWITLTQTDRVNDIWQADNGDKYQKNSNNSWSKIKPDAFERHQDKWTNAMSRYNSNFEGIIQIEQDKAKLIFDSSKLISNQR